MRRRAQMSGSRGCAICLFSAFLCFGGAAGADDSNESVEDLRAGLAALKADNASLRGYIKQLEQNLQKQIDGLGAARKKDSDDVEKRLANVEGRVSTQENVAKALANAPPRGIGCWPGTTLKGNNTIHCFAISASGTISHNKIRDDGEWTGWYEKLSPPGVRIGSPPTCVSWNVDVHFDCFVVV